MATICKQLQPTVTGVVETTGVLRSIDHTDGGCRLRVATDTADLDIEDSISVHGVCLTAERVGDGWFEAVCSRETVDTAENLSAI